MDEEQKGSTVAPTISDRDLYEFGLSTRNFEISMFWERSNYFLVLHTALAVGFFTTKDWSSVGLAAFGIVTGIIWFQVCLGGKFWQVRWEQRLAKLEKKVAPDLQFFAADWSMVYADVDSSLRGSGHTSRVRLWLDRAVLRKPSVSFGMTLLSLAFCAAWIVAALGRLWEMHPWR